MSTLQKYRIALQIFQSRRLRRDFADLVADPQYKHAAEFFFDEMYGPRDFRKRDSGVRRLHQFLHIVPGVKLQHVQQVLELLELTNRLDDKMVNCLLAIDAPIGFDEPTYEHAYRYADNYDDRLRQLDLIVRSTTDVHELTRFPILGTTLKGSGLVARIAGFEELHSFLVKGFEALQHMEDVDYFADTIYDRELDRLNRIYDM
jgi:hypothetical protein